MDECKVFLVQSFVEKGTIPYLSRNRMANVSFLAAIHENDSLNYYTRCPLSFSQRGLYFVDPCPGS